MELQNVPPGVLLEVVQEMARQEMKIQNLPPGGLLVAILEMVIQEMQLQIQLKHVTPEVH